MPQPTFAARSRAVRRRVSDDLEALEPQRAEPQRAEAGTAAPVRRAPLVVGAADDRAEHEADAVADRVLARLGESHQHAPGCGHDDGAAVRRAPAPSAAGPIGAAGGDLDDDSSARIEAARGGGQALPGDVRRQLEGGFGHSLADVRVHTGAQADGLSRRMSAKAFTTGKDIFFGAGQFAPDTREGLHTLAHEIAHTRQGAAVRRKMHGTAQALEDQGNTVTDDRSKSQKAKALVRKVTRGSTNWEKIVEAVRAYEAEEDALTGNGRKRPDAKSFQPKIKKLTSLLHKVQTHIAAWRKANDDAGQTAAYDNDQADRKARAKKDYTVTEDADTDVRTKVARRQQVNMLAPRVANELLMLQSPGGQEWLESDVFSDDTFVQQNWTAGGLNNQVSGNTYADASGAKGIDAVFKAEHGFKQERLKPQRGFGVRQIDPNFGARSVALYRLDKLFGAGVTARAEFAVGKNANGQTELGQVLHEAQGKQGAKVAWGVDADHAARLNAEETDPAKKGKAASLEDPVLQRGLNRLQLLDAIAGQLDRHESNYFVQVDDGKVTGITGIDLDEAFGEKMNEVQKHAGKAQEFRGIPELIDETMGRRILAVTDKDIQDALYGLLSDTQIAATLARFQEVRAAVQKAADAGALRNDWGEATMANATNLSKLKDNSYHNAILNPGLQSIRDELEKDADKKLIALLRRHPDWQDHVTIHQEMGTMARSWMRNSIAEYVSVHRIPSKHWPKLVKLLIAEAVEAMSTSAMIVALQEEVGVPASWWGKVTQAVGAKLDQIAQPFQR